MEIQTVGLINGRLIGYCLVDAGGTENRGCIPGSNAADAQGSGGAVPGTRGHRGALLQAGSLGSLSSNIAGYLMGTDDWRQQVFVFPNPHQIDYVLGISTGSGVSDSEEIGFCRYLSHRSGRI